MNKTFTVDLTFKGVKLFVEANVATDLHYVTPYATEVLSVETLSGDDITDLLESFDSVEYALFMRELCKVINESMEDKIIYPCFNN